MNKMISRWVVIGIAVTGLSMVARPSMANNVVVMNTSLKAPVAGKVQVQFDLSWSNSWRDGVNYDACWVFVKYSTNSGTSWDHAVLGASGTNPAGFSSGHGTNLEIIVPADKLGAFIQRSVEGTGTVANTDVQLVWDFTSNGVSKSQSARIKVFAIEMIYVPEGAYYLGDGSSDGSQFEDATNGTPFLVTNENYEIILGGGGVGSLGNNNAVNDDFNDSTSRTLPAAYPKGYAAFYMMKTEASQRQYCDFLNTLTYIQQTNRCDISSSGRRFIKKTSDSPGFYGCDANNNAGDATNAVAGFLNETNDGEWVGYNNISWSDIQAYVDWAALRPFSELEFEKACRGTNAPVMNEYAWGSTYLGSQATAYISSNTAYETVNKGNCFYSGASATGPYRVGCYATNDSSRVNAGAGYYGALDLSGSLTDFTLNVGSASGRAFTGWHGDGILDVNGNSPGWGAWGMRGDPLFASRLRLSDRSIASWSYDARYGAAIRGVRTAPASVASPGSAHDAYTYGGPGDSSAMDQMSQDKSLDLPAGTIFKIR